MEATSFTMITHNVTPRPLFGLSELRIRKTPLMLCSAKKRDRYRHGYEHEHDSARSRLVDENMIVLHKRIDELRAADRADPDSQFDWGEWERDYYAGRYGSDVSGVVGLVRFVLMSTRPSVAIGLVAILILGVPTSMTLVGFHLVDAFRSMFN